MTLPIPMTRKKTMKTKAKTKEVAVSAKLEKLFGGKKRKKRRTQSASQQVLAFRPRIHGGEFYLVPHLI